MSEFLERALVYLESAQRSKDPSQRLQWISRAEEQIGRETGRVCLAICASCVSPSVKSVGAGDNTPAPFSGDLDAEVLKAGRDL